MIIATGATGTLNGATVGQLLKRVPPARIGVSVRDPDRAKHLADRGVRVRQGSYDDPAALRHSFADAEQVLLVSSNDITADVVAQHREGDRCCGRGRGPTDPVPQRPRDRLRHPLSATRDSRCH